MFDTLFHGSKAITMPHGTNGWLNVGIVDVYFISNQNAWKWWLTKILKCCLVVLSKNSKRPHTYIRTTIMIFFFNTRKKTLGDRNVNKRRGKTKTEADRQHQEKQEKEKQLWPEVHASLLIDKSIVRSIARSIRSWFGAI